MGNAGSYLSRLPRLRKKLNFGTAIDVPIGCSTEVLIVFSVVLSYSRGTGYPDLPSAHLSIYIYGHVIQDSFVSYSTMFTTVYLVSTGVLIITQQTQ